VCIAFRKELGVAVGAAQFAVGEAAGVEKVQKLLSATAEARPSAVFLALDFKNAYNSIARARICEAVAAITPGLGPFVRTLCRAETRHWFFDPAGAHVVSAVSGVDQGCPLSPVLFAIGIAPTLASLQQELRAKDPEALVVSYLDDIYVVIRADLAPSALDYASSKFAALGLHLNPTKCKAWQPRPGTGAESSFPPSLEPLRVPELSCLGSVLAFLRAEALAGDVAQVAVGSLSSDGALRPALVALEQFSQATRGLRAAGLPMQDAFVLHRTFTDGAVTHLLRAGAVAEAECRVWDSAVVAFWEAELGSPLTEVQRAQFFLPLDDGGLGFQSAEWRRDPAVLGSWELCFRSVALAAGFSSALEFRDSCPLATQSILGAVATLRAAGVSYAFPWAACFGEPRAKQQKAISEDVYEAKAAALRSALSVDDRADVDSAGGGGGLFLLPPLRALHRMCDEYFAVSLRRRLCCQHPAHDPACVSGPTLHCKHPRPSGGICGEVLDARGHHAACCPFGGGVVAGHDGVVTWLARWLEDHSGHPTDTEQYVAAWTDEDGTLAKLDISFVDAEGRRAYVDVAFASASSSVPATVARHATEPGVAAADMVARKRRRYKPEKNPGVGLVPFVVESLGRVSPEAQALLRAMAPSDAQQRSAALRDARQTLAVLVQTRLAEQLLSAEAGRRRSRAAR